MILLYIWVFWFFLFLLASKFIMHFFASIFNTLNFDCFSSWRDNKKCEKDTDTFVCTFVRILFSMTNWTVNACWKNEMANGFCVIVVVSFRWFLHVHSKQDNQSNIHSYCGEYENNEGEKNARAIRGCRCCCFFSHCFASLGTFFVILATSKLNMCDLCLHFAYKWHGGDTEICVCWLFALCDAWNVVRRQWVPLFFFFIHSLSLWPFCSLSLRLPHIASAHRLDGEKKFQFRILSFGLFILRFLSCTGMCFFLFSLMSLLFLVCLILKIECAARRMDGIWVKTKI